MSTHPYILIVDGGIIGCAIAYRAAKEGLSVTVIERGQLNGEASGVAAGLLAPSGQIKVRNRFAELATKAVKDFPELADELYADTGIDIDLDICGTLRIAQNEAEVHLMQLRMPLQQQMGFDVRWISTEEAYEREPTVHPGILGAIYSPYEGQVTTHKLTEAYVQGAMRYGAVFVYGTVENLITDENAVKGVQTADERVIGGQIILATGAWTPLLAKSLHIDIPIKPERGQLITVDNYQPVPTHIVFGNDIYVALKHEGHTIIGSTQDESGYDNHTTVAGISELTTACQKVIPALSNASFLSAQAGLRAKTMIKSPIIGPVTEWKNLSIAAGHNSNGILLSDVTAQYLMNTLQI